MQWPKQRQHPRFKASVPVELRRPGQASPLRAQTGDISLGGCYVEMTSTQALAREVEITLWIGEEKVVARGVVVSSHPSFGNGIKFTQVANEGMARLQQFVESLNPFGRAVGTAPK
jgi:PilZ domain